MVPDLTPISQITEEDADFTSGKVRLHRRSIIPSESPWARLVLVHGYGEHSGRYSHAMRWFAERGVACHAFDQRGHGKASGRRGFVRNWDEFLDDMAGALEEEETKMNGAKIPRFVLGHSHGALIVAVSVIRKLLSADGVILTSPYFRSGVPVTPGKLAVVRGVDLVLPWARFRSGMQESWLTSDQEMLAESRADPLLLRTATPRWYLSMLAIQDEARQRAAKFTLPLLCLVGDADPVALPEAGARFFEQAASHEKKLIRYPGMLHELLRETGREAVFGDALRWMRERVPIESCM
jgi:alpha-beta hydrolase superfamily lysophospholipase